MKRTQLIMGMPITIVTASESVTDAAFSEAFEYFRSVDEKYSPYIETSEVAKINDGRLRVEDCSAELHDILSLAEKTRAQTNGYFNVWHNDTFDPSGIVKGWAIAEASRRFLRHAADFYIEAGGDIQAHGVNAIGQPWRIGVRNPFNRDENVAVVALADMAIATSGTAIRGRHIYDPVAGRDLSEIASISVIAPSILDADRMATAAFAMGERGINFIEALDGYEGYMITSDKHVIDTSGWQDYEVE